MKTAADFPKLNLPPCRLRTASKGGELCVWDGVRGRWLVLTPEEWVRRHVLAMLTERYGVPPTSIVQEHPAAVNGQPQRADIVVFGPHGPAMLVECKAPEVNIDQRTLDQAFRYNAVLNARHVMLTNGLNHYMYVVADSGEYRTLTTFPKLFEL